MDIVIVDMLVPQVGLMVHAAGFYGLLGSSYPCDGPRVGDDPRCDRHGLLACSLHCLLSLNSSSLYIYVLIKRGYFIGAFFFAINAVLLLLLWCLKST